MRREKEAAEREERREKREEERNSYDILSYNLREELPSIVECARKEREDQMGKDR